MSGVPRGSSLTVSLVPTIGQRITQARTTPVQERLVSRVRLAAAIQVDPGTIKNWERDVSAPPADKFVAIAHALKVDLRFLAGLIDDPRPPGFNAQATPPPTGGGGPQRLEATGMDPPKARRATRRGNP